LKCASAERRDDLAIVIPPHINLLVRADLDFFLSGLKIVTRYDVFEQESWDDGFEWVTDEPNPIGPGGLFQ
jgi:hypothetical protein